MPQTPLARSELCDNWLTRKAECASGRLTTPDATIATFLAAAQRHTQRIVTESMMTI